MNLVPGAATPHTPGISIVDRTHITPDLLIDRAQNVRSLEGSNCHRDPGEDRPPRRANTTATEKHKSCDRRSDQLAESAMPQDQMYGIVGTFRWMVAIAQGGGDSCMGPELKSPCTPSLS